MESSKYFRHYGQLASLGLPIIIGQLGIILVSFADTMMVGHYRTSDLAAASFVNNVFNLVIIFSTGFSYGLTPVVGRFFGKSDFRSVGRMLKNSLAANSLIAVLLVLVMTAVYLNVDRLGQPAELLPLIRPYYLVLLASLLPVLLFNAFKQFADGITDTLTPMWILLAGNIANIFGNWCLIFGKLGCPEMGLLGAGISTLISRILTVVIFACIFFFSGKYAQYREGFLCGKVNRRDFRTLNRLGWPVGLQMGMETGSFSLATIMVGWLGTLSLAAHQVMLTVGQLGFMLYYGMAAAIAVRTSHFLGQGDVRNVRDSATAGFQLILIMAAVVSTGIFASVLRKRGSRSDGSPARHSFHCIPVRRRYAVRIFERFERDFGCKASGPDSLSGLFRDFSACRLYIRIRMRLGADRNLDVIPSRTHDSRPAVFSEI